MRNRLFEGQKTFYRKILHSFANEKFNKKIDDFTNGRIKLVIIWITRKIQSVFNDKIKVY